MEQEEGSAEEAVILAVVAIFAVLVVEEQGWSVSSSQV